ncbi:MAG: tetratricopeptide repeat protein [Candidatus Omnitrophica bacterium]|nr:tetratricopeptide repeat protein [Candidatus Omnitrophota bacterium]
MTERKTENPGISLCMIVKNESKTIKRAIDSVRDIVNEIIVVDTGSKDNTSEIAKSLEAKVFSFTWCDDFSQARNFSLKQASYSWILVLDADETIAKRDLKEVLRVAHENTAEAAVFTQRNYCVYPDAEGWRANQNEYEEGAAYPGYFDVPIIRLFRNDPRIYFEGLVHEVVDNTVKGAKKRYPNVVIHHCGQLESQEVRNHKGSLYVALLQKQLERNPEDSTTWFLLGRQYYTLGKFAEAIVFLRRVIAVGSKCEMAYDNLATAYVNSGMYEEARDILERLIELNPRYSEAYSTLGIVYYELGFRDRSINTLKHAINVSPRSFKPYFNLAVTFYREKNFTEAYLCIEQIEKIMTHFPRIYYLKFHILYELFRLEEALSCAQRLKELDKRLYHNIKDKFNEIQSTLSFQKGVYH